MVMKLYPEFEPAIQFAKTVGEVEYAKLMELHTAWKTGDLSGTGTYYGHQPWDVDASSWPSYLKDGDLFLGEGTGVTYVYVASTNTFCPVSNGGYRGEYSAHEKYIVGQLVTDTNGSLYGCIGANMQLQAGQDITGYSIGCPLDNTTYWALLSVGAGAWVDKIDLMLRGEITPSVIESLRRSYADAGYNLVGRFGTTGLVVNAATDVVLWKPTGAAYARTGALPHTITAGETPIGNPIWVSKSNTKSGLIYASSFATQNVQVSQDVALQTGLNEAVRLQVPFVIDGEYWLTGFNDTGSQGVVIPSNANIKFLSNAAFRIIPNSKAVYTAILIQNGVENIIIEDPRVIGDRLAHTYMAGSTHEWGYGITIYESRNVKILRPRVSQMTGDGIYLGRRWGSTSYDAPTDIFIDHPVIHHCRRNGISPTSADSCSIVNPDIYAIGDSDGIDGTWPKACIDIEPESANGALPPSVRNLKIYNPKLHDSDAGLYLYSFKKPDPYDFQVRIIGTCEVSNVNTGIGIFLNPANSLDVHIDKVLIGAGVNTSLSLATGSSGSVKTIIDEIEFTSKADIVLTNRTLEAGDMWGGLCINKITQQRSIGSVAILNKDLVVGRKWNSCVIDPDRRTQLTLWSFVARPDFTQSSVQFFAAFRHTGLSTTTTVMPNKIWQDPSVDTAGTNKIYMYTEEDTRVLEIGLYRYTATVGMGCNIRIVGAIHNGVLCKNMYTKSPGAWVRFQNVGGKTNIIDMFGDWTFEV